MAKPNLSKIIEVDVPTNLLVLCQQVGAGLTNNFDLLPREERENPNASKFLEGYVSYCRAISDDGFQNDIFYGGLFDDKKYHFSYWVEDGLRSGTPRREIILSPEEVVEIAKRDKKKVTITHFPANL